MAIKLSSSSILTLYMDQIREFWCRNFYPAWFFHGNYSRKNRRKLLDKPASNHVDIIIVKKYGYGRPTLGNNVRVSAGAKVCGNITVGDNSTIGLNAVIIKDVPEGSTIIPSPMMLIQEFGQEAHRKI